ncbi:hypothetical protein K1T71_008131 [Dendrolimus kikuchii]|uniref:Uncharacterized protein n=1 Tax=Dendrolimus kikuchii TaxID=765133 RepID=A0ACC1CXV5_9NEOP|nr:hypothetical protein K1T71_008131 [Dendrolimus kikuchii]
MCLAYHYGKIPANLHYTQPLDSDAIRNGRLQVIVENTLFDRGFTAINNFSLNGGNSHMLMKGHYKPKSQPLPVYHRVSYFILTFNLRASTSSHPVTADPVVPRLHTRRIGMRAVKTSAVFAILLTIVPNLEPEITTDVLDDLIDLGDLGLDPGTDIDFSPLSLPPLPNSPEERRDPTPPTLPSISESPEEEQNPVPETNSTISDDYSTFIKTMMDKNETFNTQIKEHNESLLKSPSKTILIPISIDFDDSNPYLQDIISSLEDRSILDNERELHKFIKLELKEKAFYLLLTKVYYFDNSTYPDIFKTLKCLRDEILLQDIEENQTINLRKGFEYYLGEQRPVCFVYSGMGSQWTSMGADLLKIPIFEKSIKRLQTILERKVIDIIQIITTKNKEVLNNILNCFVGITAIQIALTDVLRELGISPDYIIGHSLGEHGCAYADGCLSTEDTILSSYYRGIASIETKFIRGSMVAVGLGYEKIKKLCPPEIEIACHNSSNSSTISGPADIVSEFVGELTKQGIFVKKVHTANIAYHSKYVAEGGNISNYTIFQMGLSMNFHRTTILVLIIIEIR